MKKIQSPEKLDAFETIRGEFMKDLDNDISMGVFVSLRRIIQSMDKHSSYLKKEFGITSPQLMLLRKISETGKILISQLAEQVSLSQATVTDITKRLEEKGYITKQNSSKDRRKKDLTVTDKGTDVLKNTPPFLKKEFTEKLSDLADWEKMMILSAFERVAHMMTSIQAAPAEDIDIRLDSKSILI